MKLLIEQSLDCNETVIKITCGLMDSRLKRLIEEIKLYTFSITAGKEGVAVQVPLEQIYYIEAVDNKTFLYTEKECYRCEPKLYELESMLIDTAFVRVSKSCILNTSFVGSVKAHFSGRLEAKLLNEEKIIISKHYIAAFKEKFLK